MADGTIVIDTAIRKDGLDAGINEIEQALDGASAQFHDYGDSVQKTCSSSAAASTTQSAWKVA